MSSSAAAIAIVIVVVGSIGLILKRNLLMKLLSLNIVNTATILFFVLVVYRPGDRAPIIGPEAGLQYADPLPQALVLTSIVINLGVLALSLLFTMVLVKRYHTLDVGKIEEFVKKEFEGGES